PRHQQLPTHDPAREHLLLAPCRVADRPSADAEDGRHVVEPEHLRQSRGTRDQVVARHADSPGGACGSRTELPTPTLTSLNFIETAAPRSIPATRARMST